MDTVCSINLFDDGTEELYSQIFSRLDSIEKTFSPTIKDSELCKVNAAASMSATNVSKDFLYVLSTAQKVSEITKGALDVSAGALIDLWGINTDHQKVPSRKEIEEAKSKTGFSKIKTEDTKVLLKQQGMSLNFGAVVKCFAADEIVKILKSHKVKKAIIDLGGNIYAYGKKENNRPWIIGIKNPQKPDGNPLLKVYIRNSSIVTSGNYERYFEADGKRYHHILDTKTGAPAESGVSSSTVICSKSIIADCLSTAAFVLGIKETEKIIPLMEKEFDTTIDCIFIKPDGTFVHFGNTEVVPY